MGKRGTRGFRPRGEHLDDRRLLSGYTPSQVAAAYGISTIAFRSPSGASVAGDGAGQTIALVEEYHNPNLQASLDAFDATYNLPGVKVDVVNQAGTQADRGWAEEEALDVEWAHAMAPAAAIAVVEVSPGTSSDEEFNDIVAGIAAAGAIPGVSVVSMSWGYPEFDGETTYDPNFTTPGVTFVASSGDDGTIEWPATSADVLAVGGTSLKLGTSGGYGSETGWARAGGGLSTLVTEPSYQEAIQATGDRSTPDVSFDADPDTGVSVYVIPPDVTSGQGSWRVVGGTSVGAPAWAGILAVVNQGRAATGLPNLTGATQTIPTLYALPSGDFNKAPVTSGWSGTNTALSTAGYNTQVGLGSPSGAAFINALVGKATTAPAPTPTPPPSPTPTPPHPPGSLPKPRPIPPAAPTPTPPPVIGPPPAPLPTSTPIPTQAATPPPAPAPQSPAKPAAKHGHHAHHPKPAKKPHHPASRPRSSGQGTHAARKTHPGSEAT